MPRACRHVLPGHSYHVTHRCHDRAFLLKFACDRRNYRHELRRGLARERVRILNYCITSNHVHLLLRAKDTESMSRFVQFVHSRVAQIHNQRKGRSGAFWEDRYHATMIEDGVHLWRCMRYIDLNMVRAGQVGHPREWSWTGWGELMGQRRRNKVVDLHGLVEALDVRDLSAFRSNYEALMTEALSAPSLSREPQWSESIAVGGPEYVERIKTELLSEYTRKTMQVNMDAITNSWSLREHAILYGEENTPQKTLHTVIFRN